MSALQEFLEEAAIVEMDTAHKGAVAFGRPFIARMASEIRDMAAIGSAMRSVIAAAEQRAEVALTEAIAVAATQPDERAAAEREILDRLAKRILAEIVYCAPENRALAEEVARVAKIETDLILARHDATPKEKI